jgi:hypothetical protein
MSPRPTDRRGRTKAAAGTWHAVGHALLNMLAHLGYSAGWLVGVPLLPWPEEEPEPGGPRVP